MTRRQKLGNLKFLLTIDHSAFWSGLHAQLVLQRPKLSARRAGFEGTPCLRVVAARQSALGITVLVISIRATRRRNFVPLPQQLWVTTCLSTPAELRSALRRIGVKTRPNISSLTCRATPGRWPSDHPRHTLLASRLDGVSKMAGRRCAGYIPGLAGARLGARTPSRT
jgi:hypothetical protein